MSDRAFDAQNVRAEKLETQCLPVRRGLEPAFLRG
jgi:hypothetical protein